MIVISAPSFGLATGQRSVRGTDRLRRSSILSPHRPAHPIPPLSHPHPSLRPGSPPPSHVASALLTAIWEAHPIPKPIPLQPTTVFVLEPPFEVTSWHCCHRTIKGTVSLPPCLAASRNPQPCCSSAAVPPSPSQRIPPQPITTLSTIAIVLLRPPNTLSTSLSPGSLPRMFHTSTQRAPLVDHPPARAASVSATVCTVLQPRQQPSRFC
eukprot:GGOE01007549.1.p1 GENE.GGOE01007549.1~~GGOE01007549.1.p1  ORF type:complete len:210 (-),score=13.91 GGOE01007549.1:259-888(-)